MVAKNFYIALLTAKKYLITYPYYADEYDQPAKQVKPEKGLTEYVLRTGKSLLCDANLHQALEKQGEIELIGHPSPIWLGVPLVIDNVVIGVMVVQDYEVAVAYGAREQRILEFVSSQVAMTIRRKQSEDDVCASRLSDIAAWWNSVRKWLPCIVKGRLSISIRSEYP